MIDIDAGRVVALMHNNQASGNRANQMLPLQAMSQEQALPTILSTVNLPIAPLDARGCPFMTTGSGHNKL